MKFEANGQRKLASRFLMVPCALCVDAIRKRYGHQLKLFLLIKAYCSGAVHLTKEDLNWLARMMDRSERTIHNHLQKLYAWNWIGHDPIKGTYFVRGTLKVFPPKRNSCRAVRFDIEKDLNAFEAFLHSAVVGYRERYYDRVKKKEQLGVAYNSKSDALFKKGCAHQFGLGLGAPLSCSYLALVLDVSKSKISRLNRRAVNAGYLKRVKRERRDLDQEFVPVDKQTYLAAKRDGYEKTGYIPVQTSSGYFLRVPKPQVFTSLVPMKKTKLKKMKR